MALVVLVVFVISIQGGTCLGITKTFIFLPQNDVTHIFSAYYSAFRYIPTEVLHEKIDLIRTDHSLADEAYAEL